MQLHGYRRARRGAVALVVACSVVLTTQSVPGPAVAQPAAHPAARAATPVAALAGGHTATVTLITGDRVRVGTLPGGGTTVTVTPGPGRDRVAFIRRSTMVDGHSDLEVLPTDAVKAVTSGRIDPRLFDVTELVREHLDDASSPDLPLIVSYQAGPAAAPGSPIRTPATEPGLSAQAIRADSAPLAAMPGTVIGRTLRVLGAVALTVARTGTGALWSGIIAGRGLTPDATTGRVQRVFLDAREHVLDDESNAQIGVPVAWAAGYTGAGVKVAVLDTGYDTTHPDLVNSVIATQDFTGSPDGITDGFGHGTHVASILAGSGAASNGKYRGVAPDAKLLIGKVCDDFGECDDSAIIAGMQWAADQGARVVNLSLGGPDSPGVDPMEQAVDDLTAADGTLFVIAAGNDGPFAQSVDDPGSADAALTVASVSKQDVLSDFSSRGTRAGDDAMKPDIAAPGEDIIAARAAGTSLGDPVDQYYTSLSGTSMATPHVAGAAAILAQAHPDWTAPQLKAELMSTANPVAGADEEGQGDGRVDVARAVTQRVYASVPSVSFGLLRWPQSALAPITDQVTYANDGDSPVTLTLAESTTGPSGDPVPGGLFTLGATDVTVPAHGQASVPLTVTPSVASGGPSGDYQGRIEATDPAGDRVEVDFGATVEPESYDVSMTFTDAQGDPAPDDLPQFLTIIDLTPAPNAPSLPFVAISGGAATVRLPKSDYAISADVFSPTTEVFDGAVLTDPAVRVDHPGITLSFDARTAGAVRVSVDRHGKQLIDQDFTESWTIQTPFGPVPSTAGLGFFNVGPGEVPLHVAASRTDRFGFFSDFQEMVQPQSLLADPMYGYHLASGFVGRTPHGVLLHPHDSDLAVVRATYHAQDRADMSVANCPLPKIVPDQSGFEGDCVNAIPPVTMTELYSPGVAWAENGQVYNGQNPTFDGDFFGEFRRLPAGSLTRQQWDSAVAGPLPGSVSTTLSGVFRVGDEIAAGVPLFVPGDPGEVGDLFNNSSATGSTTLFRNGVLVGSQPFPAEGDFTVPGAPAWYTLSATGTRDSNWSRLSTRVSAEWRFRSGHTDPSTIATLPVLQVRTIGDFDGMDRSPAGATVRLSVTPTLSTGGPTPPIASVTVAYSTDGGKTWQDAVVTRGSGGVWHAQVRNPASGFVSLRIAATAASGAFVRETIIRGYAVS